MTRTIRKLTVFLLCACLLLANMAAAAEAPSLKLTLGTNSDFTDPSGVQFKLYRVAQPNGAEATAWEVVSEFKDYVTLPDVEPDETGKREWTSAQMEAMCAEAAEGVAAGIAATATGTTGADGVVTFPDLLPGIYYGEKVDGTKPLRLNVTPFMVAVPDVSKGSPNYQVEAAAKFTYTTPSPTGVSVEKKWDDDDDFDEVEPETITVYLWRKVGENGALEIVDTQTLDAEGETPWAYSWTGLPDSDDDMQPYIYTVSEEPVENYEEPVITGSAEEGFTVTNTHVVHKGAIRVEKSVLLNGQTPEEIGEEKAGYANGTYHFTITGPKEHPESKNYLNAVPFDITITDGATSSFTRDGLMPGTYVIHEDDSDFENGLALVGENDMEVQVQPDTTVDAKSATRPEDETAAYVPVTNEQPLGELTITKVVTVNGEAVTDANKTLADGTYSFTVTGPKNYSEVVTITVTNGVSNSKTLENLFPGVYTVTESDKYVAADGKEYTFAERSIKVKGEAKREVTVKPGETAEEEYTNDLTAGSLRITKRVTVNNSATTGTSADGVYWFTVTGPSYPEGHREFIKITNGASNYVQLDNLLIGTYTVAEDTTALPDRMSVVGNATQQFDVTASSTASAPVIFSFTNNRTSTGGPTPTPEPTETPEPTPTPTPEPVPTSISGQKVWNDEGNAHNTRPSSITVQLLANGTLVQTQTVTGRGNTWSFRFDDLPAEDADGSAINYTIRESAVSGYTTTLNGTTITNDLIPRTPQNYTSISGSKTWVDDNNADGARPNYIIVRLMRNGVEVERRTVTAANGWQYSFTNIPVDDGYGNTYTYAIREDAVPGYYARTNGYNLSNTRRTPPPPGEEDIPEYPTPLAGVSDKSEEELEELVDLFDYGTPLWGGLLGTGDETPIYPFIFGGIGLAALAALIVLLIVGKKQKREQESA